MTSSMFEFLSFYKFLDVNLENDFLPNWQNLSWIDGFLLCFYCQSHCVMTFIMLFEATWYFKWTLLQLNTWKKLKTSKDKYRQVILVFCFKSFQNFLWRAFVSVCPTSTVPSCIYTFVTPHNNKAQRFITLITNCCYQSFKVHL